MNLNKEIFKISIPNIISNISIPLLGIVDTALMGRMPDPAYIGAIALGGIVFNILYWGLGFVRPGTTGLTAQAYGADDKEECVRLLLRALILSISFALFLLIFYKPLGNLCFSFLNGSDQVKSLALEYYRIRIFAAPAVLCLFAFRGWFFGMQNAVAPMILTISANVINIFFSWYLVMKLNWSVAGVAWGTVIAQWVTLGVAVLILLSKYDFRFSNYLNKGLLNAQKLKRFLTVNRDMFIRNLGMILVFSFFTNYSSGLSDSYLAVNQMLLELFYFMAYAVDGFAYASESLVGKYIGSSNINAVKKVIKLCLIYGLALGTLFGLVYTIFGPQVLRIFTDNNNLIEEGSKYFIWCAIVGVLGSLAFIWDGVYSGATASVELRDSMLISVVVFFVSFYLFKSSKPYIAIWIAMSAFMLSRSVFQILLYNKSIVKRWEKAT